MSAPHPKPRPGWLTTWLAMGWGSRLVALLVVGYRLLISPWLPPSCRYEPSCSVYALEALQRHGPLRGSWLAARRIGRCHPCGGQGYDPVPDTGQTISRKAATTDSCADACCPPDCCSPMAADTTKQNPTPTS